MQQDVRKNFEEKVSYIASIVKGMTLDEQEHFLLVDCGLPSDTFNNIVVRDLSFPDEILACVERFTAKSFPYAVWYWESVADKAGMEVLIQHGLAHTETHAAMSVDLAGVQPTSPLSVESLEIKQVTTASELLQFGTVMSGLFEDANEGKQILAYFMHLAEYGPDLFPAMKHYLGTLHGTVVAMGTLFIGSETAGIYDIVTRDEYRRRGIGSAMFRKILADAQRLEQRYCVLQASKDGLGIYLRAGFKVVGDVHTFER